MKKSAAGSNAARRAIPGAWTLDDLEPLAQRYLPRAIFAWAAGGSERLITARANGEAFRDWAFLSRVLQNVAQTRIETTLLGRRFGAPFGICPMGGAPAVALRADWKMARASISANIPMMLSGAAGLSIEASRELSPNIWAQLYLAGPSREAMERLVDRYVRSGHEVLVLTVDVPVPASAVHSQRHGWSLPLRLTPKLIWDGLTHPRWVFKTGLASCAANGPRLENLSADGRPKMYTFQKSLPVRAWAATWNDFEFLRRRFSGKLIIKGITRAEDARRAIALGADAVMVSNHGGRQIDYAPAALRLLPDIVAAAGNVPVLIDGGFRHATHVMMALSLGAKFVFIGRPFLYAAALGAEQGVGQAIEILKVELHRNLALLGCENIGNLSADFLVPARGPTSAPRDGDLQSASPGAQRALD